MPKVTAAVIERDGAVLIARRRKSDLFGNVWEFPGGKIEPGESPEECLRRELMEELGIESAIGACLGSFHYDSEFMDIELLAYQVTILSGELVLNDHDEVRWVCPADLPDYVFAEPDRPLVKILVGSKSA
ncbi:MAG: (deoxy)nucleoside triphosphate pyrophosphohydrolase [Candidatus Aminicenantales bacterium]